MRSQLIIAAMALTTFALSFAATWMATHFLDKSRLTFLLIEGILLS
jgi:hypothetical protein